MERKTASDFHPEVLGLFDQYIHGQVSRRGFLKGAAKFAIAGATAASLLEALSSLENQPHSRQTDGAARTTEVPVVLGFRTEAHEPECQAFDAHPTATSLLPSKIGCLRQWRMACLC